MGMRVLYLAGSPAARVLLRHLPDGCLAVPVGPTENLRTDEPRVLLVDAAGDDRARLEQIVAESANTAVVALVDAEQRPERGPGRWYAMLEAPVSATVLGQTLRNAFDHMAVRASLARRARELSELNTIGARLSAERNVQTLLELILTAAREITHSDAGSLYLIEDNDTGDRRLRFILSQNDSVAVPFTACTIPLDESSVAGHVARSGRLLNLEDAYAPPPQATFRINPAFDRALGYRTKSMLIVPLTTPPGRVIGVLQLINSKRDPRQRFASPRDVERGTQPFGAAYADLASSSPPRRRWPWRTTACTRTSRRCSRDSYRRRSRRSKRAIPAPRGTRFAWRT